MRRRSLHEEDHIDRTTWLMQWRKSDATKTTVLEKAIGLAVLPLILLWTLLFGAMLLGVTMCLLVFQMLGRLVGGRR